MKKMTPCIATDPGATPMTWREVPKGQLLEPPLLPADVFAALEKYKPSVSKDDVAKAKAWTVEFGTEGN